MSAKEIITLQFGHYSNFVGTHWWNIQESGFNYNADTNVESEINHDVLYREGRTLKNEVTFTPRLLLVDLKGSLKTLSQCGDLYDGVPEPNTSNALWNEENVDVQQENVPPKNKLQEALSQDANVSSVQSKHLENDVEVWSDFLYARFHPRTVNVINEYSHNSEENPFDVFHLGREIWKKSDLEDEYTDRLRCYAEECDYLQGFQILTDPINAFGGVTSSCLEYIKDEYDKKAVLSFPLIPSYYSDYDFKKSDDREKSTVKDSIRLVNLLLSLDALGENCCLTVPLCTGTKGWRQPGPKRNFRNLNYNQESLYHTSAIIATALETLTTPYRTKGNAFTIGDFCSDLNRNGRKIAAASLQLPFGIKSGEDLLQCLDEWQGPLFESLTPNYKIEEDKTVQHITLRGIPLYRLKKEERYAKAQKQMPAYRCQTVEEMLQFYFSSTCVYTASRVTTLNAGLNVGVPYPDIFSELVDINGDVGSTSRRDDVVKSVPTIAGCHSNAGVGNILETLHRESGRIKIGKLHNFRTQGMEDDDYRECLNRIQDLRECYEDF